MAAFAAVLLGASGSQAAEPQVLARIETGQKPCVPLGAFGSVWVANFESNTVSRIDPATNTVTGTVNVGFRPCGLAAGAGSLWVDAYGAGRIERVNPTTLRVVRRYRVGSDPFDVAFAFGAAWSSDQLRRTVSRISPKKNRVVKVIRLGGGAPAGFAFTAGSLWVGSNNDSFVRRIDARNRVRKIQVDAAKPAWLAASRDAVWAGSSDGVVVRIDPRTNRQVARIPVGGPNAIPTDGSAAPDGTIWIPILNQQSIAVIDPATNSVVRTISVGPGPFVVNEAFGDMWVGSYGGTDVWRIRP